MTSSTKSAGNSVIVNGTRPARGLAGLRAVEAKALISVASEAASQTGCLVHDLFKAIYDKERVGSYASIQQKLEEALTCWQLADHYLRMLSSVLEEREYGLDPQSGPVL